MTDPFALAVAGARGLASTLRRVGLTPHACDVWIVEDPDGDCAHVYLDDPSVDRVVGYTVGTLDRPTPSDPEDPPSPA